MFSDDIRELVDQETPHVNPDIANGLVTTHIKQGEQYLDSVWRVVDKSFPEGLKYEGCRRLTPEEEFALRTKRASSRPPQIDLARCDFRYMVYNLTYDGVPLDPVYLQVPFMSDGGMIWISGSRYVYSPILADRVISVNRNGIFVKLLQTKIIFNREIYYYGINSHDRHHEIIPVVWGRIWNGSTDSGAGSSKIQGNTTIAHYMFARYGVTQSFKMFANADIFYGTEDQINEENYPRSEWIICSSANLQLNSRRRKFTEENKLKVAIKRCEYTHIAKALIAGIFYVTDRFTYRMDYLNIDRINLWRVMLGSLLFGRDCNEGTLLVDIDEHLMSMNNYVDAMVVNNLERLGYKITDIYELFTLILTHIDDWIIDNDASGNTVYGKELTTLYSLYFDISTSIFHLLFELKKQMKRSGRLNHRQVNEIMRGVKPGTIFGLKSGHGEISVSDFVGACKLLKITTRVTPQNRATSGANRARTPIEDPSLRIHQSWIEVFGVMSMTKAAFTGNTVLSPYLKVRSDGLIERDPRFIDLLEHAGKILLSKRPPPESVRVVDDDD